MPNDASHVLDDGVRHHEAQSCGLALRREERLEDLFQILFRFLPVSVTVMRAIASPFLRPPHGDGDLPCPAGVLGVADQVRITAPAGSSSPSPWGCSAPPRSSRRTRFPHPLRRICTDGLTSPGCRTPPLPVSPVRFRLVAMSASSPALPSRQHVPSPGCPGQCSS